MIHIVNESYPKVDKDEVEVETVEEVEVETVEEVEVDVEVGEDEVEIVVEVEEDEVEIEVETVAQVVEVEVVEVAQVESHIQMMKIHHTLRILYFFYTISVRYVKSSPYF